MRSLNISPDDPHCIKWGSRKRGGGGVVVNPVMVGLRDGSMGSSGR